MMLQGNDFNGDWAFLVLVGNSKLARNYSKNVFRAKDKAWIRQVEDCLKDSDARQ